jgi:hypothetical protein
MTVLAVVSAGLFWFVSEHWRHLGGLFAFLPYLLFLACPLMHLFMHHGHGQGHHGQMQDGDQRAPRRSA